ncbi:MAG: glutamate 5-kinase [Coriobacteriia bacterium]|nr:glutamate 5-kinase [Coriobacteriia bacterium]
MSRYKTPRRVVVKCGSSLVTDAHGSVNYDYIEKLGDTIAQAMMQGIEVILVSSGAISTGFRLLGFEKRPSDMPSLQASSAVGQAALIDAYARTMKAYNIPVGQVLLTLNDTSSRTAYLHATNTFQKLLELHALPVVNENDTVAVNEIKFGDNDALASITAAMCAADLVVIFSDVDGLYTADPTLNPDAYLLEEICEITPEIKSMAGGSRSGLGTGGMASKLKAASLVMQAGIDTVICKGEDPQVLLQILAGNAVGTRFCGYKEEHHMNARKLWISLANKMSGRIYIDDGAVHALKDKGSSLLPVGVTDVIGNFNRGDALVIFDQNDQVIARGLSRFSSEEISVAQGMSLSMIERVYPDLSNQPLIHRDELVVY